MLQICCGEIEAWKDIHVCQNVGMDCREILFFAEIIHSKQESENSVTENRTVIFGVCNSYPGIAFSAAYPGRKAKPFKKQEECTISDGVIFGNS